MSMILAVILTFAATLGGAVVLFRSGAMPEMKAAPKTQPGQLETQQLELFAEQAVRRHLQKTQEEIDARLKKVQEQVDWELGEWHEKFSTLHARTAKRQSRAAQQETNGQSGAVRPTGDGQPSVLHYRRKPWSV